MSFDETVELLEEGTLGMLVDQGLAIAAVRSGLPLSNGGKVANLLMVTAPVAGTIMAFLFAWWWFLIGVAVTIGNFRVARAECVRSVRLASMQDRRLFAALRERGVIRFTFLGD